MSQLRGLPVVSQDLSRSPTAADIPPELFPLIVDYVGTEDSGERSEWARTSNGLRDLKSCSEVCRDWANRCRPVIFESLYVHSRERMAELSARHGSARLAPVADIITTWDLSQTWKQRSWCHVGYNSLFKKADPQGLWLKLDGPVPDGLPASALHSPHWSLPRQMPRCYTPFTRLQLSDIRFSSLSSLAKLLRHFTALTYLDLCSVSWTEADLNVVLPIISVAPVAKFTVRTSDCTDTERACAFAYERLGQTSLFQRILPQERDVCLALVHPLPSFVPDSSETVPFTTTAVAAGNPTPASFIFSIRCDRNELRISNVLEDEECAYKRLEVCALTASHGSRQSPTIIALRLDIEVQDMSGLQKWRITPLMSCVAQMPSVRIIVLYFEPYANADVDIDGAMRADPTWRTPLVIPDRADITFRFLRPHNNAPAFAHLPAVYGHRETLVEIDPITMEPTGQVWDGKWDNRKALLGQMMKKYHPNVQL